MLPHLFTTNALSRLHTWVSFPPFSLLVRIVSLFFPATAASSSVWHLDQFVLQKSFFSNEEVVCRRQAGRGKRAQCLLIISTFIHAIWILTYETSPAWTTRLDATRKRTTTKRTNGDVFFMTAILFLGESSFFLNCEFLDALRGFSTFSSSSPYSVYGVRPSSKLFSYINTPDGRSVGRSVGRSDFRPRLFRLDWFLSHPQFNLAPRPLVRCDFRRRPPCLQPRP